MKPIRILHVSDLHLAEQPERHSVLDRYASLKAEVEKALLSDIKDAILSGKIKDIGAAFGDLFEQDSVAELLEAVRSVDRSKINSAIDDVLTRIMLDDGSFRDLTVHTLKNWTIASSFNPGALDCLCDFVEEQDSALNAIIITGDLATTGLDEDLEKGRLFLEGTGAFDQSIVAAAAPKMLLPGNHDRYIYTAKGFLYAPGGNRFDSVFKNHWSGPVKTYPPLRDGKDLSVVIIAADFSLQSASDCTLPLVKLSRLAQGRVYPTILEKLVETTKKAKDHERSQHHTPVVFWAIHFPPFFSYRNSNWVSRRVNNLTKNLIDELELVERAKENNVYAILAGHTHEAQDYAERKRGVRVLCAGSATQDDATEKQCQIIEVSRNRINQPRVIVREYEQDSYHSTFRPKSWST